MKQVHLVRLDQGPVPTEQVHDVQRKYIEYFRSHREPKDVAGVIYAFEFEPTITFGTRLTNNVLRPELERKLTEDGTLGDVLAEYGYAFYESPRGGGSTYLGPGQRSYMINLDLRELLDTNREHSFNTALGESLGDIARTYLGEEPVIEAGVDLGVRREGRVNKLGSSGTRTASYKRHALPPRTMTHYGASVHVKEKGLDGFDLVHACGLDPTEYPVTSLERLGAHVPYTSIDETFAGSLVTRLGGELVMPEDERNIFQEPMSYAFYGSPRSSHSVRR